MVGDEKKHPEQGTVPSSPQAALLRSCASSSSMVPALLFPCASLALAGRVLPAAAHLETLTAPR